MRVSTSTGICGTVRRKEKMYFSCEDSIKAIAKAGFDAIDMGFVSYGREGLPLAHPDWRDWVRRQKELCDSVGLPITQGHAHYYVCQQSKVFTSLEKEENISKIFRDIEAAGICNVPWLVIHPDTIWDSAGYSRRITLQKERERILRFGDAASRYGVGIAIENIPNDRSGDRCFGVTSEDLLELLDYLGDDDVFGICWDTGHANLSRINQPEAIRQMGAHLKALHINDNKGEKDEHQLPYLGSIEWKPILKALKEAGYKGDFTYEIHNFTKGFEPEQHPEAMKFACQVARRMVAEMENGD